MRYYVDSVKAIFMIIGIYYHTTMIYLTNIIWRVSSEYINVILDYAINVIHFIMHGFYIITVFFGSFLIKRKGTIYIFFNGKDK